MDRGAAAKVVSMDRKTSRDWVHRFNERRADVRTSSAEQSSRNLTADGMARILHGNLSQQRRDSGVPHESARTAVGALSREPNLAARRLGIPSSGSGCGGGSPRPERFVSEDPERVAGCEMALDVEGVEDSGVNGQEALG
jgi:hypothetical protein